MHFFVLSKDTALSKMHARCRLSPQVQTNLGQNRGKADIILHLNTLSYVLPDEDVNVHIGDICVQTWTGLCDIVVFKHLWREVQTA